MALRKQVNVGFPDETMQRLQYFAQLFHSGEVAPAVRNLVFRGLESVKTKEDYLNLLEQARRAVTEPVEVKENSREIAERQMKKTRKSA